MASDCGNCFWEIRSTSLRGWITRHWYCANGKTCETSREAGNTAYNVSCTNYKWLGILNFFRSPGNYILQSSGNAYDYEKKFILHADFTAYKGTLCATLRIHHYTGGRYQDSIWQMLSNRADTVEKLIRDCIKRSMGTKIGDGIQFLCQQMIPDRSGDFFYNDLSIFKSIKLTDPVVGGSIYRFDVLFGAP